MYNERRNLRIDYYLSIELCTRRNGIHRHKKWKKQIKTLKIKSNKYIEIHLSYFEILSMPLPSPLLAVRTFSGAPFVARPMGSHNVF